MRRYLPAVLLLLPAAVALALPHGIPEPVSDFGFTPRLRP
jgi:hypothetical protein